MRTLIAESILLGFVVLMDRSSANLFCFSLHRHSRSATLESYRRSGYDISLSYVLPLEFPTSYYFRTLLLDIPEEYFRDFRPNPWIDRPFGVGSMISHCLPERTALLEELGRYLQVQNVECTSCGIYLDLSMSIPIDVEFFLLFKQIDQFGKCGQNKDISTHLPQV